MKQELIEGEDFYYDEHGYMVFTEAYHLQRGTCCGNGCRHCPFDYINVDEPKRSFLQGAINNKNANFSNDQNSK